MKRCCKKKSNMIILMREIQGQHYVYLCECRECGDTREIITKR